MHDGLAGEVGSIHKPPGALTLIILPRKNQDGRGSRLWERRPAWLDLFHNVSLCESDNLCASSMVGIMEAGMSAPVALRDAQADFSTWKWAELRSFASNDLIALTYINAFYPDRGNPGAFFWGRKALSTKRSAVTISAGNSSTTRDTVRPRKVNSEWANGRGEARDDTIACLEDLWPMFATNRARGRNIQYNEVEVYEGLPLESRGQKILRDCINWLRIHQAENPNQPKKVLIFQAQERFGGQLTVAIFNVAYKIVSRFKARPASNFPKKLNRRFVAVGGTARIWLHIG